jgi:hypothetical protein
MHVFADNAPHYVEVGFRVFPTGGDDGKKPLIQHWPRVGKRASVALAEKFPNANLGIIDGDIVTRIDVDDPSLTAEALERFGDTPIKVGTPSGGCHLWYRASGERRVIKLEGEEVDVLGWGGFGNAPPSVNPNGGAYKFLEGTLADVPRLPRIKAGALPQGFAADDPGAFAVGQRNKALFAWCLRDLKNGHDPDTLWIRAAMWNEGLDIPLVEAEVAKTAASAARYHVEGRNWIRGSGILQVTRSDFETFNGDADSLYLFAVLKFSHGSRVEPFAIVADAMAVADTIPGWGAKRYQGATKRLLGAGKLLLVKRGHGRGNPHLYAFTDKTLPKGGQYN